MAVKSCCAICYKKFKNLETSDYVRVLNEKGKSLLKRFFKLIGRYVEIGPDGVNLVDNLIDEGVTGACDDCFEVVKSFCKLYEDMKEIELKLNWKVWTLKNIMYEAHLDADKMKTLKKTVKGVSFTEETCDKEDHADNGVFRKFKKLKAKLVNHCNQKVLNSSPSLRLPRCDEVKSTKTGAAKVNNEKTVSVPPPCSETEKPVSPPKEEGRSYSKKTVCLICYKTFATHIQLGIHRRKEHRIIKCQKCAKIFTAVHTLKCHRLKNKCVSLEDYKQLPFSCDICPKRFFSRKQLTDHKRKAHGPKSVKCGYCSYSAVLESTIKRHIRKVHKEESAIVIEFVQENEVGEGEEPSQSGSSSVNSGPVGSKTKRKRRVRKLTEHKDTPQPELKKHKHEAQDKDRSEPVGESSPPKEVNAVANSNNENEAVWA